MFGLVKNVGDFYNLGPREFVRQKFKLPAIKFAHDTVDLYKTKTRTGVNNVREVLIRGTIIALITAILVWLSILMYVAFYYAFVPAVKHERAVHLTFKPCNIVSESSSGMCSFPSAHVQLTDKNQLLMTEQPYKVYLNLEMPESPVNRELGMFMVCVDFRDASKRIVANSCRSAMLHYKSSLIDTIFKIVFSPFFIFGSSEEKQIVRVELFSEYQEHADNPVTDIYVEVQSRRIEVYSAKLTVNAEFSGLRYVMFNWPVLSATLGITANLFFIALTCLFSWYRIINSEEYMKLMEKPETNEGFDSLIDLLQTGKDQQPETLRHRTATNFADGL